MFKKLIILTACAFGLGLSAQAQTATSPNESATEVVENGVWIDVRTSEEFEQGHLPQAINISHEEIGEQIEQVVADKSTPIHLYCRSGRRAELARQVLESMGYVNVINHGAYKDLVEQTTNQ
ncbi:rhodanese-like domain-containing protein [Rappaport israeli]|uniref:rhodanese-like domain-containing protein n=1 Tax=Rappaport israeli TaxID=1839807 RepID=UPI000931635F|nr:rhodanese-like domain-containing protein [Rappaport israeli]